LDKAHEHKKTRLPSPNISLIDVWRFYTDPIRYAPTAFLKNTLRPTALLAFMVNGRLDIVVMRLQALLAIVVILPFALWRVWHAQYVLAGLGFGAVMLLAGLGLLSFNTRRFDQVGRYVLPVVVIGQMVVIGAMIALAGPETKSWAFPVLISSFLLLRAREATAITLTCSAADAWLVSRYSGHERDAAIFFACCLLVVLFTHLFASRLQADRQKFKTRSLQDALTGVGNRRQLDDTLAALVRQPQTTACTLIMLDIDYFKQINDRFGHNIGDTCLTRFAHAIESMLGAGDTLYRFGGEEFVVLCGLPAAQGFELAQRLRQHIEQTSIIRESKLTMSAGVAPRAVGQTVREWINRADAALYQAKASGRNQVVMADIGHAG
jgi:diguanylate cyclase (GGDEF)-like protein